MAKFTPLADDALKSRADAEKYKHIPDVLCLRKQGMVSSLVDAMEATKAEVARIQEANQNKRNSFRL